MGDRALIHLHDGQEIGPCVYLHSSGWRVAELIQQTQDRMESRGADVSYCTARLIGIAHESLPGCLSIGVWNAPSGTFSAQRREILKPDYSHGDAGVFLVDVNTWTVECSGGYGLKTTREIAEIYKRMEEFSARMAEQEERNRQVRERLALQHAEATQ